MLKVANKGCIRRLAHRSLRAARARNIVAALAIALTTVLFTAVFTIGMTIVVSYEQQTFRQVGGDMHGTFKDVSEAQMLTLMEDPLIVKPAARLILGIPTDAPFNKAHVEVSYMDESCAEGYFCVPTTGRLPQEGTKEIACDTRILKLLGVDPVLGAAVEMPFDLSKTDKRTDTFTLTGWWEYDPASMASQAIVPRSYVEAQLETKPEDALESIGKWALNVYFRNSNHIQADMDAVLQNRGYQSENPGADNYIATGVNWAYTGAQFAANADPGTMLAIAAILLLIVFTGYLIIYNIFRISVTSDIRFYGLLKTIGTTGRQLRAIIRRQALLLSAIGIPVGLILGWLCGVLFVPVVMGTLEIGTTQVAFRPVIFIGAALFSLVTVLISCRRPGRIAARVSPIEAVRYTEGTVSRRRAVRRGRKGARLGRMAYANLGRSRVKTVLVIVSLSLSVVLMQLTYTFANGFDMDKYLRQWVVTDFILANADYFQTGGGFRFEEQALPEEAIDAVGDAGEVTASGRIYGLTTVPQQFVTEEWYRQTNRRWKSDALIDQELQHVTRDADGRISDDVHLYGMEALPLDNLTVLDGDLAPLYDPSQNAIAAVYLEDDYGSVELDSQWAQVGDQMTVRYVDAWEHYDLQTGQTVEGEITEQMLETTGQRAKSYRDVTYTVVACVTMRHSMSYRFYGTSQFVLNSEVFQRDTGTSNIMSYLFNTTVQTNAQTEAFLKDYTENIDPLLDFESKQDYVSEFYGFRNMFMMMGSALSLVVGVVGILNFFNAILTGILTRRREFAVLQAVGMTGRQLRRMLVFEGLYYAGFAVGVSLILSLAMGPLLQSALQSMFWFFTYRFSVLPVVCIAPVFLALGVLLPLVMYRVAAKQSVVERIRADG